VIKLKYEGPFESPYWEFATYQELVRVVNGECKVQHEETAQTLELHGFKRVGIKIEKPTPPETPPVVRIPSTLTSKEKKVLEMYNKGDASISMIAKSLRISRKKVEEILDRHKSLLKKEEGNV